MPLPTLLSIQCFQHCYLTTTLRISATLLSMFTKQILSVLNLTCSGDKHSIIRIVDLAAVYSSGDKLPMLVTDKTKKKKKTRCFKNNRKIPCRYGSQRKNWINSVLFEEWVRHLNKTFKARNKRKKSWVDY